MRRVLLTLIAVALLPLPAASQDCIDYGDYLHRVAVAPPTGQGMAISGSYAYSVARDFFSYSLAEWSVEVHDISDPRSPQFVARVHLGRLPYPGSSIAVAGNYAYVTAGYGLHVVDISDPAGPEVAGGVDTPGEPRNVTVSGNYAYVADGNSGLQVIDLSDPTSPQLVIGVDTPDHAWDVTVSDDYAYVSDGYSGLQVIDIADPANPQIIGGVDTSDRARGVTVSGDYAYIANLDSGLQVIDISNPVRPQLVGGLDTPGRAVDVTVSGDHAYVADGVSGLQVVDISDPTSPQLVVGVDTYSPALDVTVSDDYAYVQAAEGLHVFDISNAIPAQPVGGVDMPGRALDVTVSGDYAYIADSDFGLQVVDISDPANPHIVGVESTPCIGVAVSGDYAYVTAARPIAVGFAYRLEVVNISDPTNPQIVGGVQINRGRPLYVTASGDYAYVTAGYGLQVIDISDPVGPQRVGWVDVPGLAVSVAVSGDYAYVTDDDLRVVDISDPVSPRLVANVDTPGSASRLAVSGMYAYLADRESGLQVVDVTNPSTPQIIGNLDTPGLAHGVTVSGDHAYVTTSYGLYAVDITNPAAFHLVGGAELPASATGVTVSGNYVYMMAFGDRDAVLSGLRIARLQCDDSAQDVTIDIKPGSEENPINCKGNRSVIPVAVLTTDTFDALTIDHTTVRFGPGEAAEVHMRRVPTPNGNGALSLKSASGVPKRHEDDVDHDGDLDLVFHFARAETGIVCGDTEAVLTGQTYDGQSIFGSDTIQTVPDGEVEPESDAIVQISPNPFNPATSITFVVREPQHVTVRIYDVRGQLVAELADGTYSPGRHVLEWRGRDTSGRLMSSGMYFFRVDRGGQVEIRKALLIK